MRLVPIECVREGSKLGKTIYDEEGRSLLQVGADLTENVIKKIQNLNIFSIYVIDEYSQEEIDEIIKPEVRQKSTSVIRETFKSIDRIKSKGEIGPKAALSKRNREYFLSIYTVAEDILNEILSNNTVLIGLVDIKSMDNYTYQHCVNVAVISLVMGISMKMKKTDLIELCIGALIHDIGKSFIPKEITTKMGELTEDEVEVYKQHTVRGYDYLNKNFYLKDTSALVALQHHERADGNGFPKGLKENEIHIFSKIVAIANKYDELTSDLSYKRSISASDALEYIMSKVNTEFDFETVSLFTRIIIVYPAGTLVRLSNNEIAVVESTPTNFPLRPTVKILKSDNTSRVGQTLELLESLSLVITDIVYDI